MPAEEAIVSFVSDITVRSDNSITVVETITYDTGPQERHGIYRDIYPYSSQKRKMSIEDVVVTDDTGAQQPFVISQEGKNVRIKIGDADKTFTGQRTYLIAYRATRAVAQFDDFDELYWNVSGDEWVIPKYHVQASIQLPGNAEGTQSACYFGVKGSTDRCQISRESHTYIFQAPTSLNPAQDMTIALGFAKGIVSPYSQEDLRQHFFELYLPWIVGAIWPVFMLLVCVKRWLKYGRDEKGKGLIVPQYDAPKGLSPMQVSALADNSIESEELAAEIIQLAVLGYIEIRRVDEAEAEKQKALSTDFELIPLRSSETITYPATKKVFDLIFQEGLKSVRISEWKYRFYVHVSTIVDVAMNTLVQEKMYKKRFIVHNRKHFFAISIMVGIFAALFFGGIIGTAFGSEISDVVPIIFGLLIGNGIFVIMFRLFPARTSLGSVTREHILGLKEYLMIAEKDRLEFHNAPEKTTTLFEHLLPYAMALGVVDIWIKEFEDMYSKGQRPQWFHDMNDFHKDMRVFGLAVRACVSSPNAGSGGGGSSGGGGGGGGGGGW